MTMITDSSKRVIPFRPNDARTVGPDCFYIDDEGNPIYLTEGVGGPSMSPWAP